MKQKYIDLYMDWAKRVSHLSHARRLQVGAVIVKDDSVISYGYNGMPAGWNNDCEDVVESMKDNPWHDHQMLKESGWEYRGEYYVKLKTRAEVLHAESNAIAKLARSNNSGQNADIFITHSPCIECAKLIFQSGIQKVFYGENYRDTKGIEFLEKSGIEIERIIK